MCFLPAPLRWCGLLITQQSYKTMTQINWDKAPDWAKWWAMDVNGKCYFYEHKPYIDLGYNWWNCFGNSWLDVYSETYKISGIDWRQTLTRRPAYSEKPNSHSGNRSEKPNS